MVLALLAAIQITQSLFVLLSLAKSTVYVNNILLTGSDSVALTETKKYLKRHFVTDMRKPKYFLGIEVAY